MDFVWILFECVWKLVRGRLLHPAVPAMPLPVRLRASAWPLCGPAATGDVPGAGRDW